MKIAFFVIGAVVVVTGVVWLNKYNKAAEETFKIRFAKQQDEIAKDWMDTEQKQLAEKRTQIAAKAGFIGDPIAGKNSLFLRFNNVDYNKALAAGDIIFLDFYSSSCATCKTEETELKAAFDSLPTDRVIGFKVSFNDSNVNEEDKKITKDFIVSSNLTKVILKNGKEVKRATEEWNRTVFTKEINLVLASF